MIHVVCAVIQNQTGQYLACQRPNGKHLAGYWEFPGGKINPGETPEAALSREIQEELGVTIHIHTPLQHVTWHYPEKTIQLFPFLCTIPNGSPTNHEHSQLLWCSPENFHTLPWAEADQPILTQILTAQTPTNSLTTSPYEDGNP